MSTFTLPNVPSFRRQQLLLEFASLKSASPDGVYVSLTPGDPTLWSGVIFVRKGPYSHSILRFQIGFPATYPDLPPLITFSTDIFHPLLVPLTTYTFSTGTTDTDTVSATDEERLPPGGFSLRHGFPHWFGRARRSAPSSVTTSRNVSGAETAERAIGAGDSRSGTPTTESQDSQSPISPTERVSTPARDRLLARPPTPRHIPISSLLYYVRSTFDDEKILDSIPLEAAGNPGAWHAWRTHRKIPDVESAVEAAVEGAEKGEKKTSIRAHGKWNWEGVWEKRVQNGIDNSLSDPVLFGNVRGGSDDMIRFLPLDEETLQDVKTRMIGTDA